MRLIGGGLTVLLALQPGLLCAAEISPVSPLSEPETPAVEALSAPASAAQAALPAPLASPAAVQAQAPVAAQAPASAAAQPPAVRAQLSGGARAVSGRSQAAGSGASGAFTASQRLFDGGSAAPAAFVPAFEAPAAEAVPAEGDDEGGEDAAPQNGRGQTDRPQLSFPHSIKGALLSVDPAKSIYGTVKAIRETPRLKGERKNGSEKYWDAFRRGVAVDVVSGDENVFGRATKVTSAATKAIGRMSKEDFKGIVPAFQLQLSVRELRQKLIERLDENRQFWHRSDAPISLSTRVRVLKFQSYIDLYKEVHGKQSAPQAEPAAERTPLTLKAQGQLETLSRFPPRLVFLDVDSWKEPLSAQQAADMAELQRTGVYFVAFSRRPYDAPGGMHDVLVRHMSGAQLTAQMPNRFLAVTDDGAVISKMRKDGTVEPIDMLAFSQPELEVLQGAGRRAAQVAGIPPAEVLRKAQPPVFIEGRRFNPFQREKRFTPRDPNIRFELVLPKSAPAAAVSRWAEDFRRRAAEQGLSLSLKVVDNADGTKSAIAQKTDLRGSLERLDRDLGEEFGLYTTPSKSDVVVLSDDPALRAVNPRLDLSKLTDLKGPALVENVLGLILGEARKGGKKGSASRMIQFSGYRERYMSEFIVAQDAAEQHVNFFSGHVVHANNDWLISQLQHGRVPTPEQYAAQLRERWNRGIRETKPVGIPAGTRMERLLNASVRRGLQMYGHVVAAYRRGEILVGTEIPNFIVIETYKRGENGKFKERYIVHTIFDFVALRPDPAKPGHATLVTYDFKTGPAKSVQKLEKDDQVLTYSLFNYERWVGKPFPVPYLSGERSYIVDDAVVEFIYNLVQKPTITPYDRERQRARIPRVFEAIARTEAKLLGVTADGRPVQAKKGKAKKGRAKGKAARNARRRKK